jgi:hypothetical protein
MNTDPTSSVRFLETKRHVLDRGSPPDSFLDELVKWARGADHAIFLPNDVPLDVYGVVHDTLGPWFETPGEPAPFLFHRRAVMCEVMRVHAGFESSWNWREGVDKTNRTSMRNIEGQETGIFQVSHDSLLLDKKGDLKAWLNSHLQTAIKDTEAFIDAMKEYHPFALEFYARLVRINTRWAGPLLRGEILPELRHNAVDEFIRLLT